MSQQQQIKVVIESTADYGGYPAQQAGYPGQQGGYPGQQAVYPGQQGLYPGQQGGYPTADGSAANLNHGADSEALNDMSDAFGEKAVRRGFIRKVYAILTVQLLITFGITCIFFFTPGAEEWLAANPAVFWVAFVMSLVLIIVLSCAPNIRRKAPLNYIFLLLFTACEGFLIGVVCSQYSSEAVLKALVTTIVIVIALTLFAFQTKIDFTMMTGALFALLCGLIMFGIMAAIFQSQVMDTLYAALGAILFSVYIVVDTQLIMGGKHRLAISPEEYIFAALNLYLDVINLFLFLLRLFGNN